MDVHQIDVVSVQSFYYHGKVVTEESHVHGVYLIGDVVRLGLHCVITHSLEMTVKVFCFFCSQPTMHFLCLLYYDLKTPICNEETPVMTDMPPPRSCNIIDLTPIPSG